MSSTDLDRLLIDNLADLEGAATRVHAIEAMVFKALDHAVAEWAKRKGWVGEFDFHENELWLAPPQWALEPSDIDGEVDADAWFALHASHDAIEDAPGEDIFNLTRFCGLGQAKLGYRFSQNRWKGRAHAWRTRVRSEEGGEPPAAMLLEPSATYFLSVQADPAVLKEGLALGSFEEVLEPFVAALDRLESAVPFFDRLLGPRKA